MRNVTVKDAPSHDGIVARARRVLRRQGTAALARRAVKAAVAPLIELGSVELFVRDLDEPLPTARRAPGIDVALFGPERTAELLECGNPAHTPETLGGRFARGDLCFVATDADGRVAHVRWATTGDAWVPEIEQHLVLPPDAAYFYDGFTRRDMRRHGIDGLIRCFIFETLKKAGKRRAYSYVRGDNVPGLRAAGRWQQRCAKLRWARLFGGRPRLLGSGGLPPSLGLAPDTRGAVAADDATARERRADAWRRWFESWTTEPCSKRSTGYSDLPEEYFSAMAGFIASSLGLREDGDRVLDVGCDSAMVTRHVAPRCQRLVGVDYVPELLLGRPDADIRTAADRQAGFVASDGRRLPFRDGTFSRAYCSGVLHTLPSQDDGLQMIREMVRVCRPGGTVLVAALPDAGKRRAAWRQAWRRSGWGGRLRLVASRLLPRSVKRSLRRRLGIDEEQRLVAIEFDLDELRRQLEAAQLRCETIDFPADFWSGDFRTTRGNLLIHLPGGES